MKNKLRESSPRNLSSDKNLINSKEFSMIVQRIYDKEFLDTFINILNYSKKEFFENISSRIKNFLSEQYNSEMNGNEKLLILINSFDKQYEQKYKAYLEELNQFIEKYKQNKNNGIKDKYITNFRKHCSKTEDYAKHNCNQKNKKGNFVPVYIQAQLKYVFCIECHKVFLSNKFSSYCNKCGIDYYSNILDKNENKNLLPATWENYHCKCTINQKINCQNCNGIFYVDCKYNILKCLKCKNYRSPRNMENTCSVCNKKYASEILIFNPLEKDHLYDLLNNAIITKNRARPSKLPCCTNINISNIKFYHNSSCKGILYLVQFKTNLTVICEKCKQFFYYDKFVWTCPSCGEEFKEEKLDSKISSASSKNNIEIPKKNYLEDKYSKYMRKKEKSVPNVIALANEKYVNNKRNNNSNSKNDSNYEAYSSKNTDRKNRKDFSVDFKNYQNNENNELKDFSPLKSGRKNVFSNKNDITPMKSSNNEINSRVDLALKYINTRNKQFIDKKEFVSDNKNPKVYNVNNLKQRYLNNNVSQKDSECESNEHIPFLNNNNSVIEYKINSDKFFGRQMLQDVKSDSTNDTYRHIIKKNDNDKYKINNYLIINRDVKFNFFMNQINKMTDEKEKNYANIYNNYTNSSKKNIKNNYNNNTNNSKNNINAKNNYKNNTNNNKNSSGANSNSNIKKEGITKNESSKILPHRKNMNEMRDSNVSNGYKKKDLHLSEKKNNGQQNQSLTKDENPFDKNTSPKYKMRNVIVNNNNNNDKYKDNQNLVKKMEDNNKIKVNKRCLDKDKVKEKIKSSSKEKVIILKDERPKKINYSPKVGKNEHMRINLNSMKFDSSSSIKKIEIDLTENKNEKKNEVNNEFKNKFQNYKFYKKKMNESLPQPPSQSQNIVEEKEKSKYDEKDERKKLLKDIEQAKIEMEKNKPDDIIEYKDIDFKKDLPIEDPYLLNHPESLAKMQKDLKRIIFKCHLPLFDPNCYYIEKKIGEGTYGAIFQVTNLKTKKKFAMKKIITNNLLSLKFLKSEFEITYENIHPHILNIYGINLKCFDSNTFSLCVLMDLAETDWDLAINERYKTHKNYTEQELISILKQLTSALIYLQREKKIAHRDIKPENVLIFKSNIYKLADFGEAKAAKANNKINTLRGTDIYMSPLLYNGLKSSKEDVQHNLYKSDVFSLGYTLLYAITFHYDLLNELRDLNDYDKIKKILYERLKPRFSDNFIELILKMINPDEKSRIDFIGLDKLIKELL